MPSFQSFPNPGATNSRPFIKALCPRPESSLLKMMNANMYAVEAKNQVGLEEKTRLTNDTLELNTHLKVSLHFVTFLNDIQLIEIASLQEQMQLRKSI